MFKARELNQKTGSDRTRLFYRQVRHERVVPCHEEQRRGAYCGDVVLAGGVSVVVRGISVAQRVAQCGGLDAIYGPFAEHALRQEWRNDARVRSDVGMPLNTMVWGERTAGGRDGIEE